VSGGHNLRQGQHTQTEREKKDKQPPPLHDSATSTLIKQKLAGKEKEYRVGEEFQQGFTRGQVISGEMPEELYRCEHKKCQEG
jgi:hypothetical protein